MFGCMGERDCESQGKRGPGIPLPGNLISDTRRIRIMIFVIISPPASYIYICTFSSTMYTIRVNLFLIDWPSVVPCTMESGESLTDTHIRSPSDSASDDSESGESGESGESCDSESGKSLTDTHIRSPSDSALSQQRHQFEKTLH